MMNTLEQFGVSERYINEGTMYPEYSLARVIAQHRGVYKIATEKGILPAEISGKFRYETEELAKFPTVGDFVMVGGNDSDGNAIIHQVLTRKSLFLRSAVGKSGQGQCVAANIEILFICMSLNNNFNLSRLERYMSIAWDSGATPVILLTKADLCENLQKAIADVNSVASFSDVIPLSIYDEDVSEKLSGYLKPGITAALIGSSGVGKSTLINRLLGEDILETCDIGKEDKGRHTTTGRQMFVSPFGGVIIDTPGMREVGIENADIEKTFDDIEQLAAECKFRDCTHTNEPGCAVIKALEKGTLDQRHYENYCKLKIEMGYDGLSSKEIETKKLERMFKDIGGMKNKKKYVKDHSE